jgi:hypothetical protein
MKQAEWYRAHADQCQRFAEHARHEAHRALLLNMEECWRALAVKADLAEEAGEQASDNAPYLPEPK